MHKLICLCCHDLFYHPKTPYKGIFCLPFDKLRALLISHYSNKDVVLFLHPGDPAELCDSPVSSHFCISPREHLPWSCCLLFDAQHKGSPSDLTLPASPQRWLQSESLPSWLMKSCFAPRCWIFLTRKHIQASHIG